LRELHECHERWILSGGRASRARRPETCDARAPRSSLCNRKRKGEALQIACGVYARSTRRAASLPVEGSTHLRGCGMTAVGTDAKCAMSAIWSLSGKADVADIAFL
jgi:hypothetical protein